MHAKFTAGDSDQAQQLYYEGLRCLTPEDIADAVVGALLINERGFIPEFSVFATNPF